MTTITSPAEFAEALQAKFAPHYAEGGPFAALGPSYNQWSADKPGRKWTRIVADNGTQRHVHAFVENATGHVYKAAGWPAPAKGVRFYSMDEALAAADENGSYLYAR